MFSHFLSSQEGDFSELAAGLTSGELSFGDIEEVDKFYDFIDLTVKYGGDKVLESDMNAQTTGLALGKVGMIHNGSWAEGGVLDINPDCELGFIGHPNSSNGQATLMVDPTQVWRINKDGENIDAVKEWMEWLVSSEYGKTFFSEKMGDFSPVIGSTEPNTKLAVDTAKFIEADNTLPWVKTRFPDGFEQQIGAILQKYIMGSSREEINQELTDLWVSLAESK